MQSSRRQQAEPSVLVYADKLSCVAPPLSPTQKNDLRRLWEVQWRDIVDVRTSSEATPRPELPSGTSGPSVQIMRLHAFFIAFLKKAAGEADQGADWVKDVGESCFLCYARLFLELPILSESDSAAQIRLRSGRRVLRINYEDLKSELEYFCFRGPAHEKASDKHSFHTYLHFFPKMGLSIINSVMALAVATLWRTRYSSIDGNRCAGSIDSILQRFLDTCQLTLRLVHMETVPMANIKTGFLRKLTAVKGHIVKSSPKRLRVATADFECQKCSATITHAFYQGRYSTPTKCTNSDCRSRTFFFNRSTARYIDVQGLRLQETQEESTLQAGRTPRQLEVVVSHDLVDACRPGDTVLLVCYVDAINSAIARGRTGKYALETSTYKLFLQGHSITTMSESDRISPQEGAQVVYTQQQLRNITQLCHADHRYLGQAERLAFPFDLLVNSLCPSIVGHYSVKAGLLLCLLGGTPPSAQSLDRGSSIRSNSHILIVGDPGTRWRA